MAMRDERWHRWCGRVQGSLALTILFLAYGHAIRNASPWRWDLRWLARFALDGILLMVLLLGAFYLIGCAVAHGRQARDLESRRNAGQR
jgi:hypothetical protein